MPCNLITSAYTLVEKLCEPIRQKWMYVSFSAILWFLQITILQYVTQDLRFKKNLFIYIAAYLCKAAGFCAKEKISKSVYFLSLCLIKLYIYHLKTIRETLFNYQTVFCKSDISRLYKRNYSWYILCHFSSICQV